MQDVRALLQKEVDRAGGVIAFAELIGCSREYVYLMLKGERVASRKLARVIEAATNNRIKRSAWDVAA